MSDWNAGHVDLEFPFVAQENSLQLRLQWLVKVDQTLVINRLWWQAHFHDKVLSNKVSSSIGPEKLSYLLKLSWKCSVWSCVAYVWILSKKVKAATINIFILKLDQRTMCNLKGPAHRDQHTDNYRPAEVLWSVLVSFSKLFWFKSLQLY